MLFSCFDAPFFSISVRSPEKKKSSVEIKLVDPEGREQGMRFKGEPIPGSQYRYVNETPGTTILTLVHAIEICDATPGEYRLTVYEHGSERYLISVTAARSEMDLNALSLYLKASEGRVRHYRLMFRVAKGQPTVAWLDDQGHEQIWIQYGEW